MAKSGCVLDRFCSAYAACRTESSRKCQRTSHQCTTMRVLSNVIIILLLIIMPSPTVILCWCYVGMQRLKSEPPKLAEHQEWMSRLQGTCDYAIASRVARHSVRKVTFDILSCDEAKSAIRNMQFISGHVVILAHNVTFYLPCEETLFPPQCQPSVHADNAPNKVPVVIATHPVAHNDSNAAITVECLARSVDTTIANLVLLAEERNTSRI